MLLYLNISQTTLVIHNKNYYIIQATQKPWDMVLYAIVIPLLAEKLCFSSSYLRGI